MSTHFDFGYAAYHCNVIMQSAIAHVADYHPLTLLQRFVSTVKQPEGYPDAIPLHIALSSISGNEPIRKFCHVMCAVGANMASKPQNFIG